ncbi:MAG: hypothetical protein WDN72_09025 [Alphaproteobacteria bacterium]
MSKHDPKDVNQNTDQRKMVRQEHTHGSRRADAPRDQGHDAGGKNKK